MSSIQQSIAVCLISLFSLLWLLRRDRVSLGLPFAYLAALLLIHVPGAFAHDFSRPFVGADDVVAVGIRFTAIGSVCFVLGVGAARGLVARRPAGRIVQRHDFWTFCILGGWFLAFGLGPFAAIPSIGSAIDKGGAIWVLGVMLGLRAAFSRRDVKRAVIWGAALLVYPLVMLLFGGYLSYGSTTVIIACSILAISIRSQRRVVVCVAVAALVGLTIFVNYFNSRDSLRGFIAGNASLQQRTNVVERMFSDPRWFDLTNPRALSTMETRLNQNYFVGLAATRIQDGEVDYLYGRSVWEGVISVIPRALWPGKTVFGGSPDIVREMTGLPLSTTTSWGIGNVMEFQINYGTSGVVLGFLLLGGALGLLDVRAAMAESRGDSTTLIRCFLPALALIQPNGSMVELMGGSASALAAAYGWAWVWKHFGAQFTRVATALRRSVWVTQPYAGPPNVPVRAYNVRARVDGRPKTQQDPREPR